MVPVHSTTNSVFTTIQCKMHVTNRLGRQQKKWSRAVSDIFFTMFFHNQLERVPNALGARCRELPRRDHFRDSNDVEFHEGYRKILRDRCKSRLTSEMSNTTLFKHLERWKWRLFTFAKFISRRTYVESDVSKRFFSDNRVAICRWVRASTVYDASISSYRRSKFRTL